MQKNILDSEIEKILSVTDHTNLSPTATKSDILLLCDEALEFHTASVCIPPSYVKTAKDYLGDRVKICTVVGFPKGYNTTAAKVYEAEDAIASGADEIDMVINLGLLKDGNFEEILAEIKALRKASSGKILKVIIETCLLTNEEKIKMCEIVSASGADFIKTSTGFSTSGATFSDIELFKNHISGNLQIKAAGGISSLADAEKFIKLGAKRLGTSKIVKIIKEKI